MASTLSVPAGRRADRRRLRRHRVPPGLREAIREGRVAGVVLFADNFPSRAAGRRLIAGLQAIPRPPRPARPAAGDGRPGGRPGEAGRAARRPPRRGDGRSRRRLQPRQGRRTAANLRDVGVNVDLAPVLDVARPGGDDRRNRTRLRLDAARGRGDRGPVRRRRCRRAASRRPASTSRASARRAENTDFAVQRIGLSKATLRGVDEAPYRPFIAAGGDLVMLSTAIYPALLRPSRRLLPRDRDRRAARPPRLRRRLDHRRARNGRGEGLRRPREGGPGGEPGRAPTSCSSPTLAPRAPASGRSAAASPRTPSHGRAFEQSAGRVLRLRHGLSR